MSLIEICKIYIEIILSIYCKYKLCVYPFSPTGITPAGALMNRFLIPKKRYLERSHTLSDFMTDNLGLTYVAVRNCDLERFSVK